MRIEVRPAFNDEIGAVAAALRNSGLGANVGRLLEFPRTSPAGEILVAYLNRRLVGGAAVAQFGTTGWIGALGVVAEARRRGVGRALTEAAVASLRQRGAGTALLYATEAGRPIYEQVGFVTEGDAHAWRDVAPPPPSAPPPGVREVGPGDHDAVRALDAAATGEDRAPVLEALLNGNGRSEGLVLERDGGVAGSALRSPWGLGPSVVADDAEAGLALLSALRRRPGGPLTVSVPDANRPAVDALRAWGLRPINHAARMRLGPPAAYEPERLFGLYNLFWG
jgi:GNAT superfamily N-acetyltransferase